MPNWKKVVVSGSDALISHLTASGGIKGDTITGTVATATQATIDHDSLANFVANEHIDHSGVSVVAGTGLTGGGTIASNRTLNVIGGTGITANANDIAITDGGVDTTQLADDAVDADKLAANAVVNASIASSAAIAHTKLAALAATKVLVGNGSNVATAVALSGDVTMNNAGAVTIANTAVETAMIAADAITGAKIADDAINSEHYTNASIDTAHIANDQVTTDKIAHSLGTLGTHQFTGSLTGSFTGDGSSLTGITAAPEIDGLGALGGTGLHQTQDHFVFSDNGTEKKITFSNLEDAIFGNVSGDATIAAGGALTIGGGTVENSMLADDAVGADELAANAVVNASVASSAAIAYSKLAAMTSARILVGNGSNVPTVVAVSGDATLANNGAVTLAAAQTNVNSILATDLVLGEDSQTKIDFETANEIHFDANNAQVLNVKAGGIDVTGNISASGNFVANQITASGNMSANQLKLNNYLHWGTTAGDNGYIQDDGTTLLIGYNDTDVISVHDTGTNVTITGDLNVTGATSHITASGNISASGNVIAANVFLPGQGKISFDNSLDGSDQFIQGTDHNITIDGDNNINLNSDVAVNLNTPSVSSSGTITTSKIENLNLLTLGDPDGNSNASRIIINQSDQSVSIFNGDLTVGQDGGVLNNLTVLGNTTINRKFTKTSGTDGDNDGDIVFIGSTSTTLGKIYYFNSSGGWTIANADAEADASGLLAVALGGNSTTNGMLLRGMVTIVDIDGTEDEGKKLFLKATDGLTTITAPSTSGHIVRILGYVLDNANDQIWFNPDNTFVEVA